MVLHWQREGRESRGMLQLPPGTAGTVQMTEHGHLGRENAIWRFRIPENSHPYAGATGFSAIYRESAQQPSWESF